jgi:hypothetical protein
MDEVALACRVLRHIPRKGSLSVREEEGERENPEDES